MTAIPQLNIADEPSHPYRGALIESVIELCRMYNPKKQFASNVSYIPHYQLARKDVLPLVLGRFFLLSAELKFVMDDLACRH